MRRKFFAAVFIISPCISMIVRSIARQLRHFEVCAIGPDPQPRELSVEKDGYAILSNLFRMQPLYEAIRVQNVETGTSCAEPSLVGTPSQMVLTSL